MKLKTGHLRFSWEENYEFYEVNMKIQEFYLTKENKIPERDFYNKRGKIYQLHLLNWYKSSS